MIGIPYRIYRENVDGTPVDKTVYLGTPRSGEKGAALRQAMRTQRRLSFDLANAAGRLERLQRAMAGRLEAGADPAGLDSELAQLTDLVAGLVENVEDATQRAVVLSLCQVYGTEEKAGEVLDQLSATDLSGMLATIEQGQQPKDFFPSPAVPQK